MGVYDRHVSAYAAAGLPVFPVDTKAKRPAVRGWREASPGRARQWAEVGRLGAMDGLGIVMGTRCPCEVRRAAERKARFDKTRPSSSRRGYSRDWEKARRAYLDRHPLCAFCGRPAAVVDHITPHKGDDALFWDKANWQPLCTPCHSGTKQRLDRRNSHEVIR